MSDEYPSMKSPIIQGGKKPPQRNCDEKMYIYEHRRIAKLKRVITNNVVDG